MSQRPSSTQPHFAEQKRPVRAAMPEESIDFDNGPHSNEELTQPGSPLPLLPLRGVVLYPLMWLPITVGQQRSLRLIEDIVAQQQRLLALAASLAPEIEEPGPDEIHTIGVVARIHRLVRLPDGTTALSCRAWNG